MNRLTQKRMWLWGWLAVALVAAAVYLWNSADDLKDRRVWNSFRSLLTDTNVTRVEVSGAAGRKITLSEADKKELLGLLRQSRFDRSNRVGHGPTPEAFLHITFADGRQQQVSIWGGDTYELSPRWLDDRTQFLIRNDKLGRWLQARFRSLNNAA